MKTHAAYSLVFSVLFLQTKLFHRNVYGQEFYSWDNNNLPPAQSGRLNGPVLLTLTDNRIQLLSFCVTACVQLVSCQSVNFLLDHVCELLNVTIDSNYDLETSGSDSNKKEFVHVDTPDFHVDWGLPVHTADCGPHGISFSHMTTPTQTVCLCHQGWRGTDDCNEPVVTSWSEWSDWSMCSVSCGPGYMSRSRSCDGECVGESQEYVECQSPCGVWDTWSSWSVCTFTDHCGVAVKTRQRRCPLDELSDDTDVDDESQSSCRGFSEESLICDVLRCDAPMRTYSEPPSSPDEAILQVFHKDQWYGVCHDSYNDHAAMITCQEMGKNGLDQFSPKPLSEGHKTNLIKFQCKGTETAISECQQEIYQIPGHQDSEVPCDKLVSLTCKVDGYFEPWGEWEVCTISCGGGTQSRSRECVGTKFGGKICEGISNETIACNEDPCPVDCIWLEWSLWSYCNVTCGGGSQTRYRNSSGPLYGGISCMGESYELQTCSSNACPVDCVWLEWSSWSHCNVTCGGGFKERYRNASGPFHGGNQCEGNNTDIDICSTNPCPVDCVWLEWSAWSPCNVTCGGAFRERYRNTSGPFHGGNQCEGNNTEKDICSTNPCPVDGIWTDWSEWSDCSVTCGSGFLSKNRTCVGPLHGGLECAESGVELQNCSIQCSVQGDWSEWSIWSMCSVTCDGGTRSRPRACNTTEDVPEGQEVVCDSGEGEESEACHQYSCTPVAGSCEEWKEKGLLDSTAVEIAPNFDKFWAFCVMDGFDGYVVTQISHNVLGRQSVNGFESQGGFMLELKYNSSLANVISLVDKSLGCRQFISWECYGASIKNPSAIGANTYWTDRFYEPKYYWGGASYDGENCACGDTDTCFKPETKCNCDANDEVLRKDEGYLDYLLDLPVTQFLAGDTGGGDEHGFARIGPLECYGTSDGGSYYSYLYP